MRGHEPGHQVGPEDVDLLGVPPLLGVGREQVDFGVDDPGVVDEHVDATVPLHDVVDPRGQGLPVGDRSDGARPALDGVPGILKGVGHEPADAARGAGHDGHEVATAAVLRGRFRRDLALVVDRHLGGGAHARCTAPTASAADRSAVSRRALTSSVVNVRSGARKVSR